MGSESDKETMMKAADVLEDFGIGYEVNVLSAHRMPNKTAEYAKGLINRDIKVVIAGAGKAAHLPGVIASHTILPVIGVPIKTSDLKGMDSLLSIVQMPSGIPVATVAIDGAKNAALLAMEILGISNSELTEKILNFRKDFES